MAWSGKASRGGQDGGRAGTGTPGSAAPRMPATTPPAAGEPRATNTPEGLRGRAWRDAARQAASALHAAQRRQAGRYVKVADRAPGSQYRPGQNRRST